MTCHHQQPHKEHLDSQIEFFHFQKGPTDFFFLWNRGFCLSSLVFKRLTKVFKRNAQQFKIRTPKHSSSSVTGLLWNLSLKTFEQTGSRWDLIWVTSVQWPFALNVVFYFHRLVFFPLYWWLSLFFVGFSWLCQICRNRIKELDGGNKSGCWARSDYGAAIYCPAGTTLLATLQLLPPCIVATLKSKILDLFGIYCRAYLSNIFF